MAPMPTRSEADSMRLLASYGVPVVDERVVATPREAGEAAAELGPPVVVKLCGPAIAHKTERGLVRLNLGGTAAVEAAAAELLAAATPEDGVVELLVARMVRGSRELIAGFNRDPQFGATVMIGFGGVLAEAVADVAFRLAPLSRVDAEEMIDDLATQRLLGPFRGEPAVDRDALVDVIVGLAALADGEPGVSSVDVNPLVVDGGRPVAVDALVETTG
jgi:succinyl-CoA synthetase beta subunit